MKIKKLKTLKDIELDEHSHFSSDTLCSADRLRDVAKEWFEHFKKARDFYIDTDEPVADDYTSNSGRIQYCIDMMSWIEEFFNLDSDEDE